MTNNQYKDMTDEELVNAYAELANGEFAFTEDGNTFEDYITVREQILSRLRTRKEALEVCQRYLQLNAHISDFDEESYDEVTSAVDRALHTEEADDE